MSSVDWPHLFGLAEEILALSPWKSHEETDLFAIQPRQAGEIYFASIMGRLGEHRAIAYYPGREALTQFQSVHRKGIHPREFVETMMLNEHLQLAFEARKHLSREDLRLIKSAGKSYRGTWPAIRSHRPARVPWPPNRDEAADFAGLLAQTLALLKSPPDHFTRPLDSSEFFLRTWDGKDSVCRVAKLPVKEHVLRVMFDLKALASVRRVNATFEIDLALMRQPLSDVPAGEPPYFPMLLAIVESATGTMVGMQFLSPLDGIDAIYARAPGVITELIKKANAVPKRIAVRHPALRAVLTGFAKAHGIEFKETLLLPAADEAIDSIASFMKARGRA